MVGYRANGLFSGRFVPGLVSGNSQRPSAEAPNDATRSLIKWRRGLRENETKQGRLLLQLGYVLQIIMARGCVWLVHGNQGLRALWLLHVAPGGSFSNIIGK